MAEQRTWLRRKYDDGKKFIKDSIDEYVAEYKKEIDINSIGFSLFNPHSPGLAGIPSVAAKGAKIFILPLIKIWESWNYYINKDPKAEKPTLTAKEVAYFLIDAALFGLAVAGLVLLHTIAGAIIGLIAASICAAAGVFQYRNYLKTLSEKEQEINAKQREIDDVDIDDPNKSQLENELEALVAEYKQTKKDQYTNAKRALNLASGSLYVASAALVLTGLLLGPVGLPVIAAGVAIALAVSVVNLVVYVVDIIKKRVEKEFDEHPQKYASSKLYKKFKKGPEHDRSQYIELGNLAKKEAKAEATAAAEKKPAAAAPPTDATDPNPNPGEGSKPSSPRG